MKLKYITFTGIDDYTEVSRLGSLTAKYPYAEFGLLVSKDWMENGYRFPDPEIIWDLANLWSNHSVSLSCHLCGSLAKEAAQGDFSNVFSLVPSELFGIFTRFQLNVSPIGIFDVLHRMPKKEFEVIVQMPSPEVCHKFLKGGSPTGMSYLLDGSGGRGIDTPVRILEVPEEIHIGYAGGIGSDNVEYKLRSLLSHPSNNVFWIDMESRVRTEDNKFDLDEVEKVLEISDKVLKEFGYF